MGSFLKGYTAEFDKYRVQLNSLGVEEAKSYFMNGLNDNDRIAVLTNLDNMKTINTIQQAAMRLDFGSSRVSTTSEPSVDESTAFLSMGKPRTNYSNMVCACCNQRGHGKSSRKSLGGRPFAGVFLHFSIAQLFHNCQMLCLKGRLIPTSKG